MERTKETGYYVIRLADGRIVQIERSLIVNMDIVDKQIEVESHQYVDLGLSVKWATCNIGASKPEEYGDYFAWGETEIKSSYTESNYSLIHKQDPSSLVFCQKQIAGGCNDLTTTYIKENDVAKVRWGDKWRVPTVGELNELKEKCEWVWTIRNGVHGYLVNSKVEGYKNQSIFIPAAGCRSKDNLYSAGAGGYLWSSSQVDKKPETAFFLSLFKDVVNVYYGMCFEGMSIRPVSIQLTSF